MFDSSNSANGLPKKNSWLTRNHALALVLIGFTVAAFVLCAYMIRPFLAPLASAAALATLAHPIHRWLEVRVKSANIAAFLSVCLVVLILMLPIVFVMHQLVQEASANFNFTPAQDGEPTWRESLKQSIHGTALAWIDERINLAHQIDVFLEGLAVDATAILRDSVWTIVNVMVAVFSLFFLLRDWRDIIETIRSLMPLSNAETDEFFRRVSDTIHGTIYGSLVISLVQGTPGTLIFWWLGLPAPLLWGMVLGVLATIPTVGTAIVWVPTAIGLILQDEWGKAAILVAWETVAIGVIDNVLFPIVVGTHLRMHTLYIFFAVLGGLIAFGPAGIILGPLAFALTQALVEVWRRRTAGGRGAEVAVGAAPTPAPAVPAAPRLVN